MRRVSYVALPLLLAFLSGYWVSEYRSATPRASATRASTATAPARKVLYYRCPMHPNVKSDHPGTAPCCGMPMEPVYADGSNDTVTSESVANVVNVSAEKQQLIGVQIETVRQEPGEQNIRTVGRVAADENRIFRLNASTELWVRKLFPPTTGSIVAKDEPLLGFYTTNFLTAAAAYTYALDTQDRNKAASQASADQKAVIDTQVRQGVELLQNLGVSDTQIEEMRKTRKIGDLVTVRSPAAGFILARNATLGQWLGPGSELYQIAALDSVWILADLFEREAQAVRPGAKVTIRLPYQGRTLEARVANVLPQFDPETRTMKVRLEAENRNFVLRPGMFVDVDFRFTLPSATVVPAEAVLDSGLRKTVFVARGDGYFEPRRVETGWRHGDRVQIISGLMDGERVVVSGNFLIDSESRMREAAAAAPKAAAADPQTTAHDPVCGMDVDMAAAKASGHVVTRGDKTYYFCSDQCKRDFEKNPAKYGADH
jgi:membrane fusion protein, copper/silver efflux system